MTSASPNSRCLYIRLLITALTISPLVLVEGFSAVSSTLGRASNKLLTLTSQKDVITTTSRNHPSSTVSYASLRTARTALRDLIDAPPSYNDNNDSAFGSAKLRMEDEVTKLKEEHYNEVEAMKSKLIEYISVKEDLDSWENEYGTRDELLDKITTLQRDEVTLIEEGIKAKEDNASKDAKIDTLNSDVDTHVTTIAMQEGTISELETKLQSVTPALEKATLTMESMEQGFVEEVIQLESRVSTATNDKMELEDGLSKLQIEKSSLESELGTIRHENTELKTLLSESNATIEEAKVEVANLKVEKEQLLQQAEAMDVKYQENERQLKEMAIENAQLLQYLEAKAEHELEEWEAKSESLNG